jgi:hypothetical protein
MVEVKTPPATSPGMVAIEVTSPMGTTEGEWLWTTAITSGRAL